MKRKNNIMPEYKLGYGDIVEVKFFNNESFNETITVRPDGRITMARIDDIYVNGMTPSRLDRLITEIYSEIIIDPEVTVFVRDFGGYKTYVLGEVGAPGGYPVQRDMTILQAIAVAGGTEIGAKMESVMVLRKSDSGTVKALKLDLTLPLKGEAIEGFNNNILIQPQDIVYVPKTFIADTTSFLKQIYDGVLPPLYLYLQAMWWYDR